MQISNLNDFFSVVNDLRSGKTIVVTITENFTAISINGHVIAASEGFLTAFEQAYEQRFAEKTETKKEKGDDK